MKLIEDKNVVTHNMRKNTLQFKQNFKKIKKHKREGCHEHYRPERKNIIREEDNYGMIQWNE